MKLSNCKCGTCFYARKTKNKLHFMCHAGPVVHLVMHNNFCKEGLWIGKKGDMKFHYYLHDFTGMYPETFNDPSEPVEPWWLEE